MINVTGKALSALLLAVLSTTATAQVFKYQDASGVTTFSDVPCVANCATKTEVVEVAAISVIGGALRAGERAKLGEAEAERLSETSSKAASIGASVNVIRAEKKETKRWLGEKRANNRSGGKSDKSLCSFYQNFVSSLADFEDSKDSSDYAQRMKKEYEKKAERHCS